MARILYLLSGNLSTTPRALQSAKAFSKDHTITILGINRSDRWNQLDQQLIIGNQFSYESIPFSRNHFFIWLLSKLVQQISLLLSKSFSDNVLINAYASNRINYLLDQKLSKKKKGEIDLIISHSSTMFSASRLSSKLKVPLIIDVEDYHPGEAPDGSKERKRRALIMKSTLPKANLITYASPLIGDYTKQLLYEKIPTSILINNTFPKTEFLSPKEIKGKLKFVWFSQTITFNRGLEFIIAAMDKFKEHLTLTLIGNPRADFYAAHIKPNQSFVQVIEPLSQIELNKSLANYDIGLAVEISSIDLNKQLALSNKIWAYLQAGLFICATDTSAQLKFMDQFSEHGIVCRQNVNSARDRLHYLIENKAKIRSLRIKRFEAAQEYAYDNEIKKLKKSCTKLL